MTFVSDAELEEQAEYNHSQRSYCCRTGVMSTCTASSYDEQRQCKFFKKKRRVNQCYHLRFNEHCDSIKAQKGE